MDWKTFCCVCTFFLSKAHSIVLILDELPIPVDVVEGLEVACSSSEVLRAVGWCPENETFDHFSSFKFHFFKVLKHDELKSLLKRK